MSELLHLAPGADWVVVAIAICGGFALYIGITLILDDFGRDIHAWLQTRKAKRTTKIGNWKVIEVDTHSKNQE